MKKLKRVDLSYVRNGLIVFIDPTKDQYRNLTDEEIRQKLESKYKLDLLDHPTNRNMRGLTLK